MHGKGKKKPKQKKNILDMCLTKQWFDVQPIVLALTLCSISLTSDSNSFSAVPYFNHPLSLHFTSSAAITVPGLRSAETDKIAFGSLNSRCIELNHMLHRLRAPSIPLSFKFPNSINHSWLTTEISEIFSRNFVHFELHFGFRSNGWKSLVYAHIIY